MKRYTKSLTAMLMFFLAGCSPDAGKGDGKQVSPAPGGEVSFFFGGRVIPGDGSPPIEDATFIVTDGKFSAIGKKGEIAPPKGSARIELTGRTVTPVFINLQAQPGMNSGKTYGPTNYTRDNVTADLSRYEYYGVIAVLTAGTDSGDLP